MCVTCGCDIPRDDHGDKANLTLKRVQRAAAAAGLPLGEAAWNIPRTIRDAITPPAETIPRTTVLLWDCDGVLGFTAETLAAALNGRYGTSYNALSQGFFPGTLLTAGLPADQGTWAGSLFADPGFLMNVAPDWHALDLLRDAYDAGYQCQVVTERPPEAQQITAGWLADWHAPPVDVHAVGHHNKPAWTAERYGPGRPAAVIDDNPATEITIASPGIDVWLPARYYNERTGRQYSHRFESWAQLRAVLGLGPQP